MPKTSQAESRLCNQLRPILEVVPVGARLPDSDRFREVLIGLECFLPQILRERHAEWQDESLDGIFPAVSRKSADRELEIIGLCILISDQTLTPLRVLLQLDAIRDSVSFLECWLGETATEGMLRIPYSGNWSKKLYTLCDRLEVIHWTYHVGYGERGSL